MVKKVFLLVMILSNSCMMDLLVIGIDVFVNSCVLLNWSNWLKNNGFLMMFVCRSCFFVIVCEIFWKF